MSALACASAPLERAAAPLPPPRAASLEEVLAAYDAYCGRLQTFSASGDLDVRDLRAGKARKLGVRLVAARGGRLYLKGSVLVVTALEVVSNGERFWFQVPSKKTVWTGPTEAPPTAEGADQAPYYALRPVDVTQALLPEPLAPGEGDALVLEADRQSFSLTLARLQGGRGSARRVVAVDRSTLLPLRSRSYDERGELVTDVSLGGFREGTPRRIVLSRPLEGYLASFSLDKVETNVPVPERAFAPRTPEGYKVQEVGRP